MKLIHAVHSYASEEVVWLLNAPPALTPKKVLRICWTGG